MQPNYALPGPLQSRFTQSFGDVLDLFISESPFLILYKCWQYHSSVTPSLATGTSHFAFLMQFRLLGLAISGGHYLFFFCLFITFLCVSTPQMEGMDPWPTLKVGGGCQAFRFLPPLPEVFVWESPLPSPCWLVFSDLREPNRSFWIGRLQYVVRLRSFAPQGVRDWSLPLWDGAIHTHYALFVWSFAHHLHPRCPGA